MMVNALKLGLALGLILASSNGVLAGSVFVVDRAADGTSAGYCQDSNPCTLRAAYSLATGGDTIQLKVDPIMSGSLTGPPGAGLSSIGTSGVLTLEPYPGRTQAVLTVDPSSPGPVQFLYSKEWPFGGDDGKGTTIGLKAKSLSFTGFRTLGNDSEGADGSVFFLKTNVQETNVKPPIPLLEVDGCIFNKNKVTLKNHIGGGVIAIICGAVNTRCATNTTTCRILVSNSQFYANSLHSARSAQGGGMYLAGNTPVRVVNTQFVKMEMSITNYRNQGGGSAIYLDSCYNGGEGTWATATIVGCTFDSCNGGGNGAVLGSYTGSLHIFNSTFINNRGGVVVKLSGDPSLSETPSLLNGNSVNLDRVVVANTDPRLAIFSTYREPKLVDCNLFNLEGSQSALFSGSIISNANPMGLLLNGSTPYYSNPLGFQGCPGTCGVGDCKNLHNPIDGKLVGFACGN